MILIIIKNDLYESGNFLISKGNSVFVADKSFTNTNPIDFDLLNHEFYLLYFENEEKEIRIIKKNQF
jgi:hypothetical protein